MKKRKYANVVKNALLTLSDERDGFWSTTDEFVHYAHVIKENGFLDEDSKNTLQKTWRGWNGDKWDMVDLLINACIDNKINLPNDEKVFATFVLYLFHADSCEAFEKI